MRIAWFCLWGMVAACGGKVAVEPESTGDDASTGGAGGGSTSQKNDPNDVLLECNRFCEKFEKQLGCTDFGCVKGCTDEYEIAGACGPLFAEFLGCAMDQVSACEVPATCRELYDALQECYLSAES